MKNFKKALFILIIIANLIGCSIFDNDSDSSNTTPSSRDSKTLFNKVSSSMPLIKRTLFTDQAISNNSTNQNVKFAISGETGYETLRYRYQSLAWDGGIAKAFGENGRTYCALETAGIYYSIRDEFVEKGHANDLLVEGKTLAQWGVKATFEKINENIELKFASPNSSVPSSLTFVTKVTIFWTNSDGSGYDYAYFAEKEGSDVLYISCESKDWNWSLYAEENSDGTYKIAENDTYTDDGYSGSYEYDNDGDGTNETKVVWSSSGGKDVSVSYAEKTNTDGDFKFYYYSDYSYTSVRTVTVNGGKDENQSYNEQRGYTMSTYLYGNVEKDGKFMVRTINNSNWGKSDEWYLSTYNATTKELGLSPIEMDFSDEEGTLAVKSYTKTTEIWDGEEVICYDLTTNFYPDKKGSNINGVYGALADVVSTSDGAYSISKSDMWSSENMPK